MGCSAPSSRRSSAREQDALTALVAEHDDPFVAGEAFWNRVADSAEVFAPLFFELSSHAMRDRPHAAALRRWLEEGWTATVRDAFRRAGAGPELAASLTLESVAMARGLLFELAVTGDRVAVDAAMARWTATVRRELEEVAG